MSIKDLIEKYENIINGYLDEKILYPEDSDVQIHCDGVVNHFRKVIEDLKDLEKQQSNGLVSQITHDKMVRISPPETYPPLRERLICALAPSFVGMFPINDNNIVAESSIQLADEIIKQLKNEN